MDEDGKSSINTAVSEPIEIKVTSTSMDDLDGSKPESCPEADTSMSHNRRSSSFHCDSKCQISFGNSF